MVEQGSTFGIACDHAGFELKQYLKDILNALGYNVRDYGTYSAESVDYPDFAIPLCHDLLKRHFDKGILICGTGNGMTMTANKFQGVRAALCWDPEIARFARLHNDANILVLPARFINRDMASRILDAFLTTDFEGGRHVRRVDKVDNACGE